MNPHTAYAEVTTRLATLPNILRARAEDAQRLERNGTLNGEFDARVAVAVAKVRKAVNDLERLLV